MIGARRLAGRYRLLNPLGEGGVGTVWLAIDDVLGRDVAIKEIRLPPGIDDDRRQEICAAAVREANIAARLRHPSIVTVHDVLVEDGRPWLVMELLSGVSLERAVAERGLLPPHQVARAGVHILAALAAAHAAGVVHRDVKPGNIFLTRTGRAVLTDFGAAAIEGEATVGRTVHLIGSPAYIAPERLRGDADGPEGDLWSLGASLYFAVEGRPPHDADTPIAVLGRVLGEPADPPERAGELGPVLLHLLAREPGDRPPPAVATGMLRDMASGRPGAPVPPPPSTGPATVPARRRRPAWPAIPAMIAALAVIAAGTAFGVNTVRAASAAPAPKPARLSEEPGKYAIPLKFCQMLTEEQIRQLLPTATTTTGKPTNREGCEWLAKGMALTVTPVGALAFSSEESIWGASPRRAHEWFVNVRNAALPSGSLGWKWPGIGANELRSARVTGAEPVSGFGAEAFAYHQYDNRNHLKMEQTYLVTRMDNLVVEVCYVVLDGAKDEQAMRAAAGTATRWITQAMDRAS
ncbi:serine/threonine-protein kinase [Spongiactinospora sp. TRM90649]|uniref:serine/threonine-protein kinase n=1 Tax=Spongiactinospora sp. TRM90649 TaxID=3031114 RepID=UPI0023F6CA71|nr:serine/threonine-protein kinase [Spongiactinospora sp. TRM90649]MDF5751034.1 serine/threonine-protein kinase [Spongiactinospora sp. TRM90649]